MKKNAGLSCAVIVLYWLFTLFIYEFGPFNWKTNYPLIFWTLNFLYILSFVIGWCIPSRNSKRIWKEDDDAYIIKKIGIMLYINLVVEIMDLMRQFIFQRFDIFALINRLLINFNDIGNSYFSFVNRESVSSAEVVGGNLFTIFFLIWQFVSLPIIIFFVLYFRKLKLSCKIVGLTNIVLICVRYISIGTNIGVFRILFVFIVLWYIEYKRKQYKNLLNKRKMIRVICTILVCFFVTLCLFRCLMMERGYISENKAISEYGFGNISIDVDSIVFDLVPQELYGVIIAVCSYLCQGYYGMSLTLLCEWNFCFGVGHSMWLHDIIAKLVPTVGNVELYQMQIEKFGWQYGLRWSCLYSWLANDVSYIGVIILMIGWGVLMKEAYSDAVYCNNAYAKVMLFYFALAALFLPCNNQVGQNVYTFLSAIFIFICWRLSRANIKLKVGKEILI